MSVAPYVQAASQLLLWHRKHPEIYPLGIRVGRVDTIGAEPAEKHPIYTFNEHKRIAVEVQIAAPDYETLFGREWDHRENHSEASDILYRLAGRLRLFTLVDKGEWQPVKPPPLADVDVDADRLVVDELDRVRS